MPYRHGVGARRCRNAAYGSSGVYVHEHPDAVSRATKITPLSAVTPYLRCPNCHSSLTHRDRTLTCNKGHSFDVSRKGPVVLLAPRRKSARGDSAKMVTARETFLATGRYVPRRTLVGSKSSSISVRVLVSISRRR